jgi:hypothetical protein
MQDGALFWIAAAVVVSAIALVLQALSALGMYRSVKQLRAEIQPLIPQVRETLTQAQKTLTVSLDRIQDLSQKASTALDQTNEQLSALNEARADMTLRVRAQMERVELMLDDSMHKVQDVVSTLHNGVIRPVREVSGLAAGVKAAVQTFVRGQRPSVAQATQDDEMFI